MADRTSIDYCDASIQPLGWGCYGPGGTAEEPRRCSYCYAYRLAKRHLRKCDLCNQFVPHSHPEEWDKAFRWKKPRRIFVQSMGDLWGAGAIPTVADRMTWVAASNPHHTLLALTKQPRQMYEWARGLMYYPGGDDSKRPISGLPPNLWLGVSVTCQADADERLPLLLQVPAAVRWISIEPLLQPVDLTRVKHGPYFLDVLQGKYGTVQAETDFSFGMASFGTIRWCVVGSLTGSGAVPPDSAWVESIVAQCRAAGVPIYVKHNIASALGWQGIPAVPAEWRRFPEVGA